MVLWVPSSAAVQGPSPEGTWLNETRVVAEKSGRFSPVPPATSVRNASSPARRGPSLSRPRANRGRLSGQPGPKAMATEEARHGGTGGGRRRTGNRGPGEKTGAGRSSRLRGAREARYVLPQAAGESLVRPSRQRPADRRRPSCL